MGTARDVALIFLSIQALAMAVVPLIVLSALVYGVYRLRLLVEQYSKVAHEYAQKLHDYVEKISKAIAEPFIRIHMATRMITTIISALVSRR